MLGRTVDSVLASLPPEGEIVVVDDVSTDGSAESLVGGDERVRVITPPERLGVARARNLGAREAAGDALAFADAHVAVPEGWFEPALEALSRPGVGAVGPVISSMEDPAKKGHGFRWVDPSFKIAWLGPEGTEPYPVPFLVGCFSAVRRDLFLALGGFDEGMPVWGMEDAEIGLRLWTLGYECLLLPGVDVQHLFRRKHPYAVGWEVVLHNMLRTAVLHFSRERLAKVVAATARNAAFPAAFARLAESDVWERRARLREQRVRDDDAFFERFGMEW